MILGVILIIQIALRANCYAIVEDVYSKWDLFECRMMARRSTISGIGYFATRNYKQDDVIESGLTVSFADDGISRAEWLTSYMFSHRRDHIDYIDIVFGHSMVFNHYFDANIKLIYKDPVYSPRIGSFHEVSPFIIEYFVIATRDIALGMCIYPSNKCVNS